MGKVYFAISGASVTGGAETVRQFTDNLKKNGVDVYIYIHDRKKHHTRIKKLKDYDCRYVYEVEDDEDNYLLTVESQTYILDGYQKVKKGIMWLSLDYFFSGDMSMKQERLLKKFHVPMGLKTVVKPILKPLIRMKFGITGSRYDFSYDLNMHLYNCEYVREYLIGRGVKGSDMIYVCGPIRDEYFESTKLNKEEILLYNPKKGREYSEQIIKKLQLRAPDLRVIPIENMQPVEIKKIMTKSKLYMDFGGFPGPERMPREAVSRHCNIITGKNGASNNSIDVPIPEEFKFDAIPEKLDEVVNKIITMTVEYELDYEKFNRYRTKAIEQKEEFKQAVILFKEKLKHE